MARQTSPVFDPNEHPDIFEQVVRKVRKTVRRTREKVKRVDLSGKYAVGSYLIELRVDLVRKGLYIDDLGWQETEDLLIDALSKEYGMYEKSEFYDAMALANDFISYGALQRANPQEQKQKRSLKSDNTTC